MSDIDGEVIEVADLIAVYQEQLDQVRRDLTARDALLVKYRRENAQLTGQILEAGMVPVTAPAEPVEPRAQRRAKAKANGHGKLAKQTRKATTT